MHHLDLVDRKILATLDIDCRQSNTAIGRIVHRSREAVKYRIFELEKQKILSGFITSINPNALGYYMFKAYLKLENIQGEREKFFSELKSNKDIYWIGISDGVFDCVFAIVSKSIVEYYAKINDILSGWQRLIVSKVLGIMVDTRQYNKKFLVPSTKPHTVVFGGDVKNNTVDSLDLQILGILANNARMPLTQIARKTKSTTDIVRTRIRNLEECGIILSYRTDINFAKLGMEFYKVFIYFRTLSPSDERSLFMWVQHHPNVLYYIRSIAPWEVELELLVENYSQFNGIISQLREKFQYVIRNYEHLIMSSEMWMPAYEGILMMATHREEK